MIEYSHIFSMINLDKFALSGFALFAVSSALAVTSAYNYIRDRFLPWPEYLALVLFAIFGACVMVSSNNLIVIFIGLEILTLPAYILAGYNRDDALSYEASIKYFVLGATASAVFLFGISFFYGATGSVQISESFSRPLNNSMLLLSAGLIFAGIGFKIAIVPFQWWTPDVYQGSPLPVTTFFATTIKVATFMAFFRIFGAIYHASAISLTGLISAVAVATMLFGNLAALFQEDIKRMLAYSSIAHAGYLLLAFVFLREDLGAAQSSMMFYLLAYIVMTAGAFTVLIGLSGEKVEYTFLSSVAGLGRESPWLAFAFTVFLLSLAGFPPTAGFFAKFYLFKNVVQNGHVILVLIAVINSLISVYYYMRPVVAMYFSQFTEFPNPRISEFPNYPAFGVIIFSFFATVFIGILPADVLKFFVR